MDVKCPYCDEGKIAKLKTRKGKDFYACSNKKDCGKMFWNVPTTNKCEECESYLTQKTQKALICENRECDKYNKKVEIKDDK